MSVFFFSFGQTAVFLIGGVTKEEKPSALFLKSGDVVIMSKQSRLCYHAVPRVMKASVESWNEFPPKEGNSTAHVLVFLSKFHHFRRSIGATQSEET